MRISDWSSDVCSSDLGGQGLAALLAFDLELARRRQLALAHMDGDLVLLHQEGDALAQLLGDAAAALHDRVDVGADLRRDEAIIARMLHIMIDLDRKSVV